MCHDCLSCDRGLRNSGGACFEQPRGTFLFTGAKSLAAKRLYAEYLALKDQWLEPRQARQAACKRCQARDDPAQWLNVVQADLEAGLPPEEAQLPPTCRGCGSIIATRKQYEARQHKLRNYVKVAHRRLPPWLIPAWVCVQLSHGVPVDNYFLSLTGLPLRDQLDAARRILETLP